jgi:putative DNA primase/helicase
MATQNNIQQTSKPNYAHHLEWMRDSGVSAEIVALSIESPTDRAEIAKKVGWKKYPDSLPLGWWVSGLNLSTMQPQEFGQFKPDEKILIDGKEVKYISDNGHPYDAIALPHPEGAKYWQRVLDDPSIPIALDEGTKKTGMLMTLGFFALALCGVWMGLKKGGKELVDNLALLAVQGRPITIVYDSDLATNTDIQKALKALATVLKKKGCILSVAIIPLELECKGIDDVWAKHGEEMVRKIMADAIPYAQWLKNLEAQVSDIGKSRDTGDAKKGKQLPPPSAIAREIAENYREKLAWESEYQLWRQYAAEHDGCWDVATEESVRELIHCHLEAQGIDYNAGYVSSILVILKSKLEAKKWNEQTGLIPLRDGVLDQVTKELKPHAPGYRFTWQLPHKWSDSSVGCQPIEDFLLKVTGSQAIANVLLAFLSAVVCRRADLQRYLELIGGGGTGKSTCMALARALAGDENTASSQLKHLENNQFETAKFYGKSLAIFPDSERWQGEVSVLKKMTGQDPIRYERKGIQQSRDYIFGGMVILSANEPIESRDKTSGLGRRPLTVPFDIRVPEYKNRNLIKEFEPYIPGLLKRVLDISPEEVTRLVGNTDEQVPELVEKKWEQLLQTNDIARWLDDKAVIDPELITYVGTNDETKAGSWLYASYCVDRQEQNEKPLSMKAFRPNLMDFLLNQLKVQVETGEDRKGRFIKGLGLRCHLDPTGEIYPRPVTKKPFGGGGLMVDCGGCVVAETIDSGGCGGCGGLNESSDKTDNTHPTAPPAPSQNQNCDGDGGNNPPDPPNPPLSSTPTATNPPQEAKHPSHPDTFANKHHAITLANKMKEALASNNADAIRDIWEEVNKSYPRQVRGFFPKHLLPEEINAVNLLLNYGFVKGVQVQYVGTDLNLKEQYGDMVLVVHSNNDHKIPLITCLKPDGCLTTWLKPSDLHKL